MKTICRFLLIFFLPAAFFNEFEIENDVFVINNETFDEIINDHTPILINFYAPWCKFSQKLQPHFENAAKYLLEMESKIKLGKVDVTIETDLANKFKIKSYPTIILFKKERQIPYSKAHHHLIIANWLISKVDKLIISINSTDSLDEIKQKTDVLFLINNNIMGNTFEGAAELVDDVQFATMETRLFDSLFSYLDKTKAVLIRKVDNNVIPFGNGEINQEGLIKFIRANEVPSVVRYSFDIGGKVFTNPHRFMHFMIFMSEKFDEAQKELEEAAINHPEITFVMTDITDNTTSSLIKYFNVDTLKLPHLTLSDAKHKRLFLPDFNEINGKRIDKFLKDVKDGTIGQFLKSQKIPENWNSEPVKVLVGKNFVEVALDKQKAVFVEFYAPWCNYCKQLEPIWERLAKELLNVPDLIIAKLDKTENDIKNIEIKSFPTLKLFLKDTNEVVDYSGPRTRESLKEFLSKYVNLKNASKNEEL